MNWTFQHPGAALLYLQSFPLRPKPGSTIAENVDKLHFFLTAVTLFFTFIIFAAIFYFAVKYRRRSPDEIPPQTKTYMPLELTWTLVPTVLVAFI
ncbi:MAG: cytochrome c oxidase subunit II transmembrane domain-containing protein, partial [Candidatus Acidiferrales bacterium]